MASLANTDFFKELHSALLDIFGDSRRRMENGLVASGGYITPPPHCRAQHTQPLRCPLQKEAEKKTHNLGFGTLPL